MVIRKQYNIGQLAEQLQIEVEKSKRYNGVVKLDILTANNILDVLNETNRREQKHQTLESALTFIEKEDGTQTNEMEMHNKQKLPDCIGMYSESKNPKYCGRCEKELLCKIIEEQKTKTKQTESVKPECFGRYKKNDNWEICEECPYEMQCYMRNEKKETEGKTNE